MLELDPTTMHWYPDRSGDTDRRIATLEAQVKHLTNLLRWTQYRIETLEPT